MSDFLKPPEAAQPPKSEFLRMLEARWDQGLFVCVGLDSDYTKIPQAFKDQHDSLNFMVASSIYRFNEAIVDATHDLVCAYKPNIAFYEAYGEEGWAALRQTVNHIKNKYPDIPVILDAKRADIGSTNKGYVQEAFDHLGVDAITVHPYLGVEAMKPFLERKDKGIIVLVRTSNPGAGQFQDLRIGRDRVPLYKVVAKEVTESWNTNGNCAVVVGATYPEELAEVRRIVGDMPILIPGIGAQGGEVEATVSAGKDSRNQGMIINSSRGIIFASSGEDFAEAARKETEKLSQQISSLL